MKFTVEAALAIIAPTFKVPGHYRFRLERDPTEWPEVWQAINHLRRCGLVVLYDQHNLTDRLRPSGDRRGNMQGDVREYVLTPRGTALYERMFDPARVVRR